MKATGIVRSIDELGRIVIPKELRKKMNLPGRHPGIEYEEEPAKCGSVSEELIATVTKKVLEALGK